MVVIQRSGAGALLLPIEFLLVLLKGWWGRGGAPATSTILLLW